MIGIRKPGIAAVVIFILLASSDAIGQVKWAGLSLEKAIQEAGPSGQLILVDLYSDHCGQCAQLEAEVWNTLDGVVLTSGMIAIKIDTSSSEGQAFGRQYPVTGLPAVILLDPAGNEIDRVTGYYRRNEFLEAATLLRSAVDPIPELEAALEADPASLPVMQDLLRKYLNHKRQADAERLLASILHLDPDNRAQQAEKALMALAKYQSHFVLDHPRSDAYWRQLAVKVPDASSIGAAIKSTYDFAKETGAIEDWVVWACALTAAHPEAGRLAYNVAIFANRGRLRGACLAEAARTAKRMGVGPAWMDSIAVVLEGP